MRSFELLHQWRILPSLRVSNEADAVAAANALKLAGVAGVELSLATPNAVACALAISVAIPDLHVAIGMVTRPSEFDQIRSVAPKLVSSPGLTRALAVAARQSGLPYLPGVQTVSEALAAREDGFLVQRFTPAEGAGGPAALRSLHAIVPDVAFCPSGGITETTLPAYLTAPNVVCVAGSWMVPRPVLENRDWDTVTELARRAIDRAKTITRR